MGGTTGPAKDQGAYTYRCSASVVAPTVSDHQCIGCCHVQEIKCMREDFGLRFDRTHLLRQDHTIEFVGQACLGQERADVYPDVGHHNDRETALSKLRKHWHRDVESDPLISHDGI